MEILFIILAFLLGVAVGTVLGYLLLKYVARKFAEKQMAQMAGLFGGVGDKPGQELGPNAVLDIMNQIMQPQVKKDA